MHRVSDLNLHNLYLFNIYTNYIMYYQIYPERAQ